MAFSCTKLRTRPMIKNALKRFRWRKGKIGLLHICVELGWYSVTGGAKIWNWFSCKMDAFRLWAFQYGVKKATNPYYTHERATGVVRRFIAYVRQLHLESSRELTSVESTIVTLNCFDDYLATFLTWVSANSIDNSGHHRQILYQDAFAGLQRKSYNDLIRCIIVFLKHTRARALEVL